MSDEPLVIQLQQLASDTDCDIEKLLNKAYLVASKLESKDFLKFISSEMKGYTCKSDKLPEYRIFLGDLKAQNPYHGLIPFILPEDMDDMVRRIYCFQSLPSLKSVIDANSDNIEYTLPNSALSLLMEMQGDFPMMPKLLISKTSIISIFHAVREAILTWSLDLERKGVLGESFRFTLQEKTAAMSNQTFHIANMQGVAGNVSGGTVNQQNAMTVQTANFESLANHLRQKGIGDDDIADLKQAIDQDPKPEKVGVFGGQVSAWLGSMITKAATGAIGIGVGVAGTVLTEAINNYYGF